MHFRRLLGHESESVLEREFRVFVDQSALGRESLHFSTTLSLKALKRPLGKALVEPLLGSLRTTPKGEKMTIANVLEVLVDGQTAALTQVASECLQDEIVQVILRLGPADVACGPKMPQLASLRNIGVCAGMVLLAIYCARAVALPGRSGQFAAEKWSESPPAATPSARTKLGELPCNMTALDAASMSISQLASRLAASSEPILVRQGMAGRSHDRYAYMYVCMCFCVFVSARAACVRVRGSGCGCDQ